MHFFKFFLYSYTVKLANTLLDRTYKYKINNKWQDFQKDVK